MADETDRKRASEPSTDMFYKIASGTSNKNDVKAQDCADTNDSKIVLDAEPPTIPKRR